MIPHDIIKKFYKTDSKSFHILITHGESVAKKAIEIAKKISDLNPDLTLIYEAAILHDIGIFRTNAPGLDCNGNLPYICHGYIGRDIMEQLGYPKHALICERHVGTGITTEDIKKNKLPLPVRNMMPETLEEKIICYADKFYSKEPNSLTNEKSVESIIKELQQFGNLQVARFYKLMELLHFA